MKRAKSDSVHPTVNEAVEKLSSIAEMDFDRGISVAANEEEPIIAPVGEETFSPTTINWLFDQDPVKTLEIIKELFHVILDYLKAYYKKEYRYSANQQSTEGIKAIMVIVGEAAKKLDAHKQIFSGTKIKSVMDLPEYKRLQDFYLSRIARKIDEGLLSKWILALSQRLIAQGEQRQLAAPLIPTKHAFVDLEAVKSDSEYDLFFIRKEDGARYFSPKLIRNIKLVCDFGERLGGSRSEDLLVSSSYWRNIFFQAAAKDILQFISPQVREFYKVAPQVREEELPSCLTKALMALLMANNEHHISNEVKNCEEYFCDFQEFFRAALHSREYHKLLAFPNQRTKDTGKVLFDLMQAITQAFFLQIKGYQPILPFISGLLDEAREQIKKGTMDSAHHHPLYEIMSNEYAALSKMLKHSNGPLLKVLTILEEGSYHAFDPLIQGNIPTQLFTLDLQSKKTISILMPCPVHQEFIHKVNVTEEFKSLLRSNLQHFLIINFQDRTSWKEHARCLALEELQKHSDFPTLTVVTLAKDTEFYHQLPPYHMDNQASVFKQHLKAHLNDENCGFYFPEKIKKAIFPKFVNEMIETIHQVFFAGRNVLPRERRQDFIEIFYLFLELKLIELLKPDAVCLLCKDGLDVAPPANVLLFLFIKSLLGKDLSQDDINKIHLILYAPVILVRSRVISAERFERMINVLKEINLLRQELGSKAFVEKVKSSFGNLFDSLTFD